MEYWSQGFRVLGSASKRIRIGGPRGAKGCLSRALEVRPLGSELGPPIAGTVAQIRIRAASTASKAFTAVTCERDGCVSVIMGPLLWYSISTCGRLYAGIPNSASNTSRNLRASEFRVNGLARNAEWGPSGPPSG